MTKIILVIPWREHPSRKPAYDKLVQWYQHYFPMIDIISSNNRGKKFNLSAARNLGAKKAIESGADIIIFNDADVFAKPEKLQDAIAHAESFNEIAVPYSVFYQHKTSKDSNVFFSKVFMSHRDKILGNVLHRPHIDSSGLPKKLWPCSGVNVVPVNIFNEIGGFEEKIEGWGPEDIVFHRRYFELYGKLFTYIDGAVHSTYNDPQWRFKNPKNQEYLEFANFKDLR